MAIRNLRLNNGQTIELDEWLSWALYSTVEFAAAAKIKLPSFSYTVGQAVPRAGLAKRLGTPSDTNMVIAKKVNHDEAFVAFSLTYEPFALSDDTNAQAAPPELRAPAPLISADNLRRMQRSMTLALRVGTRQKKPQARAPLAWFGQGAGPLAYASSGPVAPAVAISYGTGGPAKPANQRRWPMPIFIQSDRKVSIDVEAPRGPIQGLTQDIRLRLYLDGVKRRPVA